MKILCYIYEDMADFEITLLLYRLRKTGNKEIITISETLNPVKALSGLTFMPDFKIEDIKNIEDVEALIIPGGPINNEQNSICNLAVEIVNKGKLLAAICFAPQFLGRCGILDDYQYTTSCSIDKIKQLNVKDPFNRKNYIQKNTVVDRNVITAQGHGFVDFALEVCNYLQIFESDEQAYDQLLKVKE